MKNDFKHDASEYIAVNIVSLKFEQKITMTPTEQRLRERIKELSCLYEVSSLLHQEETLQETVLYHKVAKVLQKAWLYPHKVQVHITCRNVYSTTGKIATQSVCQESKVYCKEETIGSIKVCYPFGPYTEASFLEEEQKLLDKVALELSHYIEKKEQAKKEEQLRRSIERTDRLSILGEITAGIAHELNTPLGNILGFAEFIHDQSQDKNTQKDSQKIIEAAIFAREVVKKLMFFACEMPQNREYVNIPPLIDQALSLLGQNFKKSGINMVFRVSESNINAQLDSIQFTQVLFNLLINAIYASPKDSTITCDVTQNQTHVLITITDEGTGIAQEVKPHIFDPFFTTKPLGEGSGLGLSVVHGIVKSHRGKLQFTENHPQGTIVKLSIPKSANI